MKIKKYGWIPDLPDHRDHVYLAPPRLFPAVLPPCVDLRAQCPPVYDQKSLGSCTANAIAGAIEFGRLKQKLSDFVPSRLFIYYNERVIEHSVASDSGAQIRDGIKSVVSQGVCPEGEWIYDPDRFASKPFPQCFEDAKKDLVLSYQRLTPTLAQLKSCLAAGFPFVFGFTVYESFESDIVAQTGHAPMPRPSERSLGGHAVMCVGYNDGADQFIVRNSWGDKWGMSGYFTLPYAYLTDDNLASDFWTVRTVE